jgi:hypothetical protein
MKSDRAAGQATGLLLLGDADAATVESNRADWPLPLPRSD